MRGLLFILINLFLLCSCGALQDDHSSNVDNQSEEQPVSIENKSRFTIGEEVIFTIKNTQPDQSLKFYHPRELNIEKKTENDWEDVSILYCPCGASCPPPPEYVTIEAGESYKIVWSQKKSWCGEMQENGIRKYHEEQVKPGKYRIKLNFSINDNRIPIIKTFNIVE
jgi:hypothetical protein